ncbi:uncharacterized protein LOC120707005 [Panicum virgatum]|uniref:uncharacterized protein LOC120707005 n=1 Tax=Panicum virgatum TaxID=38727 RepID=UPI0019D6A52A|nr:uncharacterized protein LOC120707005 [Panicum virgatum]
MRRWLWGGCGRAGGGEAFPTGAGEEGGGWGRFLHGQFLDAQIVSNLQEAGQRVGAPEVKTDGSEPLVETPDDVEDEGAVGDGFTEIAQVLRLAFVEAAVLGDGEVALRESAEVGVGVEGARRLVAKELRFDGEPHPSGGGVALGDGVGKVVGDCAEKPSPDDAIHAYPVGGGGDGGVGEDMAVQGVLSNREEERLAPAGVEGGRHVVEERDKGANVLHRDGLRVEVEERSGLMVGDGVVVRSVGVLGVVGQVVAVVWGRKVGSGADASVGRVTIGLSEEGFLLGVGCTSEGSITRGLGAGALLGGGGGGGGLVVLQTCHGTRWSSVRWARLERR